MAIGLVVGSISAFYGGWLDDVLMRVVDIFLAFPSLLLALAIGAALGPSLQNAAIAIVIAWWPWYARLMRGEAAASLEVELRPDREVYRPGDEARVTVLTASRMESPTFPDPQIARTSPSLTPALFFA